MADIAFESGAARLKSKPLKETVFASPSSLMYSLDTRVSETSSFSSNAIVISPVFSFKDAYAKEGPVLSVTFIVLETESIGPHPWTASYVILYVPPSEVSKPSALLTISAPSGVSTPSSSYGSCCASVMRASPLSVR